MKIPVMEVFGPTIQGEGMVMGLKTMFVRTAGCDYSCSWCDSSFTWDGSGKSTSKQPIEIIEELKEIGGNHFHMSQFQVGTPPFIKVSENLSIYVMNKVGKLRSKHKHLYGRTG